MNQNISPIDVDRVVRISIDHETDSCRDVPPERLYYSLCPNRLGSCNKKLNCYVFFGNTSNLIMQYIFPNLVIKFAENENELSSNFSIFY